MTRVMARARRVKATALMTMEPVEIVRVPAPASIAVPQTIGLPIVQLALRVRAKAKARVKAEHRVARVALMRGRPKGERASRHNLASSS